MYVFLAELVEEITETASELDSSSFTIEQTPADITEEGKLSNFLAKQCCNKHCHKQFSREVSEHRDMCAQLTKEQLDMTIMGKLSVLSHNDPQAGGTHKTQHDRKRVRTSFSHHNKNICQNTFNFINAPDSRTLKPITSHTALSHEHMETLNGYLSMP